LGDFFSTYTHEIKGKEWKSREESMNKMQAGKSPTTPKRHGDPAESRKSWESAGSPKADLGDFGP